MRNLTIAFFVYGLSGCSYYIEQSGNGYVDIYGVNHYELGIDEISNLHPKTAGMGVIYKDEYFGNFTLYYQPIIQSESVVIVPQVHCYMAELDYSEELSENYKNHSRCKFSEIVNFYVEKSKFIYKLEGDINKDIAQKIALAFYVRASEYEYIDTISKENDMYFINQSGGACSTTYPVDLAENGSVLIREAEIQVCS